jgi:O-antigen/teichoic acid export membrane protein
MFTQVAQILTLAVLARLVAKDQLGTYQQLNLVYSVVGPLLLAGVPTALLYFIPMAAGPREQHAWILRAYLVLGAMGIVFGLLTIAVRHPLATLFDNPDLAGALVLYAPYVLFAFIASAALPALAATGHTRSAGVFNALVGASTMVCVVVAAIVNPTADGLAVALSAAGALLAVASVLLVRRATGLRHAPIGGRAEARRMLAYGLPMAATGLAATVGYQFDRILVGAHYSPSDFAIYALGAVEVPVGVLIAAAVTNVLAPRLTVLWHAGEGARMLAVWREAMRKTGLLLLPLFVFLMVMSAELVRLLYGAGFDESVDVFRIYLLLLPLRITAWGLIFQSIGRTRINLWASIVILVVNAAVASTLIGPFGMVGAALAAPVSLAAAALFYLTRLRGISGLGMRGLIPGRALAGTFAASVVAAAPLLAIRELAAPAGVRLLLAGLVFSALALLGLRLTRSITDDDVFRLRVVVRRRGRAATGA